MKKHISLIVFLMALCVACIIGLQVFWNYQNYKTTVKTFSRDINEAFETAVEQEIEVRHQQMITKFKHLLADTSFITITCNTRNRDSSTVFYISDRHAKYSDVRPMMFGLTDFTEKLKAITPEAKATLIGHFGDKIFRSALIIGDVYYYTPRLGDSITAMYKTYSTNLDTLADRYQKALMVKEIETSFVLNPDSTKLYTTQAVNTNLRRPDQKSMVRAGFESPDIYFLKAMKWVLLTTLLLIVVTLYCFVFTVKTLLSQHKLAELKNDFINNMTHELNTPLSSIKITAEALQAFDHSHETRKEYLEIIRYQAEKLSDMTAQILETSRLIKSTEGQWNIVDLHQLITRAIQDVSVSATLQNSNIQYQPVPVTLKVRGEVSSLLNAVVNVIDNALKYTERNARIEIRVSSRGGFAEIAIADNGMGVAREFRERIFDQFFRVPHGNTHNVKGYGLGLSYVRQVIQQHHGNVSVADNIPAGSIFTIRLPLH